MKIAVAMSGGVDSTVTAILLKNQGYEVIGINAVFFDDKKINEKNFKRSKEIADKFGFKLYNPNFASVFSEKVIEPFCNAYLEGETPNPCVRCNPLVKFKELVEFAEKQGCKTLATGHYANIGFSDGRFFIRTAKDLKKDQSYFLGMLPQDLLKKIIFPIGGFTKPEIKKVASDYNLAIAEAEESQEICFIPNNDYTSFIENWIGTKKEPGDIKNKDGEVIGRHKGIHHYTIGQRRGLGIAAPYPLYVVKIDSEKNEIIAGYKDELIQYNAIVNNLNYMKKTALDNLEIFTKIRSTHVSQKSTLKKTDAGFIVKFSEGQIGITPGQTAVFYNKENEILGAGKIIKAF